MAYASFARILCLCFLLASMSLFADSEDYYRIRIQADHAEKIAIELEDLGYDVLHQVGPDWLELVVTIKAWGEIEKMGYQTEMIEKGRPFNDIKAAARGVLGDYPDLAEVQTAINNFAANFPDICQVVDLTAEYGTPTTFEGRHIYAVKISDNVAMDEDEPAFLVVSTHHSREIVTPVIALDFIDRLTNGYGTDADITAAVNEYEIWISPVWNPDGYNEVFTGNNLWRKNRNVFPGGIGVDLNRNYPFGFETACSGSTNPATDTYKGPGPASEAETQTMIAFSEDKRFAKILDFHSSGREVLYNYACLNIAPQPFWQSEAIALSNAHGYNGDFRRPSADGEHYQWQIARMGAFGALTETHVTFQPGHASALAEAATVWPGMFYLFDQPLGIWGRVTDADTGEPLEINIQSPDAGFANGETFGSGGKFGRYYHFVQPGTYQLIFEKKGYRTHTETVTLLPDSSLELNVALQGPCPGDFNIDGEVTILEMIAIINQFGQTDVPEDVNNDGIVDLLDLQATIESWESCWE